MRTCFNKKLTRSWVGLSMVAASLMMPSVLRADDNRYQQVNLVSDQPGVAMLQDTNLVNAWGVSFSSTSPFWISDNGKGLATLYSVTNDPTGAEHVTKQGLEVSIPGDGTPTGQVFNNHGGFNGDIFLFVSEDGTISGWRPALGTSAETLVPGISNNVYKGATLISTSNGPVLLASNFRQGTVDAYGSNATLIAQFSDPRTPAGYAPFGIQSINGLVFVTFAKQDDLKHDDVAGPGNGLIDVLDPMSGRFHRFATGKDAGGKVKDMNSPWGIALAPSSFVAGDGKGGMFGKGDKGPEEALLVGNFGSGTIMTFEADGDFQGDLKGTTGGAIVIDGLWALTFGNGGAAGDTNTLFFTAGPNGESNGLFGSLRPAKPGRHGDQGNQGNQGNNGGHGGGKN